MTAPYAAAPAKSSGHPFLKAVLAVLAIMLLLVVICVGAGVYYYHHRIKPAVNVIESLVRSSTGTEQAPPQPASPGGSQSNPSGRGSSPGGAPGAAPENSYSPLGLAQQVVEMEKEAGLDHPAGPAAPAIPDPHFPALSPGDSPVYAGQLAMQPGMTITGSSSDPEHGDYEVIVSITDVSPQGVSSTISAQVPENTPGASPSGHPNVKTATMPHTDSQQDLLHATGYMPYFSEGFPPSIPGATMIVISQDVFRAIKSGRGIDTTTPVDSPASRAMMQMVLATGALQTTMSGGQSKVDFWAKINKATCHDMRTDASDAAFPVLLNGRRTTLPAIRYACQTNTQSGAMYVLDDDRMPLLLWGQNGQVTQINFPLRPLGAGASGGGGGGGAGGGGGGGGGQGVEQALKKEGHVDVYGIYFDFASDKLRPESGPVLAEIALALKDNPAWKLHVNGHTDNIGGEAFNLGLSQRRAAAVKDALVTRYQIAPDRLATSGYGLSRPIATNQTMEGRARNRRVELQRQ
jgi:hypothetical protein